MEPLPLAVRRLLDEIDAPPRLVAHLILVHCVALEIIDALERTWPNLVYDRQAILIGAATHDIGKIVHQQELSEPGHQHEDTGVIVLRQRGFSDEQARFAHTHGQWQNDRATTLEDLLVALADTIWKGKRDEKLESAIARHIAAAQSQEPWAIYLALDDLIQPITQDADARLLWHAQHSV